MASKTSNFLDQVLGRIGRLDSEGLQAVVQRLARERTFLETLFNTIEDGVMVADEHGRIVYLNQAAMRLLGVQAGQAEGQRVSRFLPALDWQELVSRDRSGGTQALRQELEVTYPRHRFLRLYAAPLDGAAAGSSGVALILHDVTEIRQQKEEAVESERIQALTLLAASVAHEIGNPLNALHIHLQLMERECRKLRAATVLVPPDRPVRRRGRATREAPAVAEMPDAVERLERYLGVAKGEITRLDYIITQFLQAIRPSPPQKRLVSLNTIVEETLALLRPELQNRGQTVVTQLAPTLPHAPLDPVQIQQVLVNLVKNAMQAMTRGGLLTVETGVLREGVWVSLSDTGCGIPPERLNRIFEPFYTTKQKGSGLGLMIVQRIVRDHGGMIKLDSHAGRGTVFRLWFPLYEPHPPMLEAPAHD